MTMRSLAIRCASAALAVAGLVVLPCAAAELQVEFVEPERYADAHLDRSHGMDERVLGTVEQHLQRLAARCLQSGDAMHIRVLDIDLAGQQNWGSRAGASHLRIMREVTWPSITLAYTLRRADGQVIEARKRLTDMNYLWNSARAQADSMPLPYERRMLSDWFGQAFCR